MYRCRMIKFEGQVDLKAAKREPKKSRFNYLLLSPIAAVILSIVTIIVIIVN